MNGIKNAMKFLWGVALGMAIVQICYNPTSTNENLIINGWSFASYIITFLSSVAIIVLIMVWFVTHWDDDKKK